MLQNIGISLVRYATDGKKNGDITPEKTKRCHPSLAFCKILEGKTQIITIENVINSYQNKTQPHSLFRYLRMSIDSFY